MTDGKVREIKFRAWDKKRQIMLGVSQLDFHSTRFEPYRVHVWTAPDSSLFIDEVDLMQFTGLHDKNGKEIWEGDVVRLLNESFNPVEGDDPYTITQVFFEYGCFCIGKGLALKEYESSEIEVLGNVWENPELLK